MQSALMLAAVAAGFTSYPGFGDKLPAPISPAPKNLQIEALVDKGPIVEMVIRCGKGSAIVSYSKLDKRYCTPKFMCNDSLTATLAATCGKPAR